MTVVVIIIIFINSLMWLKNKPVKQEEVITDKLSEYSVLRQSRLTFECSAEVDVSWFMNRNGDERAAGGRDPVDYLFKRQTEPSSDVIQPQPSADIPLHPQLYSADYYPSKLHAAEPLGFDSRRLYAQDDHQKMYV